MNAAWLLLPDSVGVKLIGPTWYLARPLLLSYAFFVAADGLVLGARAALRATMNVNRSLTSRIVAVPLIIGGGTVGVVMGSAKGGMVGLAIGNMLASITWVVQALIVFRQGSDGG